ncbi:MAG: hypothetical protein AAGA46_00120 [Cyanobacteria bacterium P01_F01_bin.13]
MASEPNLGELIDRYELELQSVLTDKMELSDATDIPEDIRDGLAAVAKLIGHEKYDPSGCSLVFVVTEQGNKYLARPSIYAYEDSVCIRWGKSTFPLDSDLNFGTDLFVLVPGESPLLLVDPSGYNLTCPVKLDGMYRTESFRPQLASKLATCRTPEQLNTYLLRGEPRVSWSDVKEDQAIEFYQIQWSPSRKDPSRQVGSILGTLDGSPTLFWAPGEIEEWKDIPLGSQIGDAVTATKSGPKEVTVAGKTFELKGGLFASLKELPIDSYKVVGYSSENVTYDGRSWVDWKLQVIIDGTEKTVSGNAYLKNYLSKMSPEITPDKPATLHIDSVSQTRDGKSKVQCRLEVASKGGDSDLLARLKQRQAELKTEEAEAPPAL